MLLCARKYAGGLRYPHQLILSAFSGYLEDAPLMLFSFFKSGFNYTTLPCSIPVLLDVFQSAQTEWSVMTEGLDLMCICSMLGKP